MTLHHCDDCGGILVCLHCHPAKKRPLNAQAQAVKDCLDAYVAAREAINRPYPGKPPVGRVVQWLGQQPDRNKAVEIFKDCAGWAAEAHLLDSQYHPFPKTVPKFIDAIPKLDNTWFDDARRNAAKRKGLIPSDPVPQITDAQRKANDIERARIARQTDCAAELRFNQRGADECGTKDECRGCPQRENPGSGRYRPASRQPRKDGDLKRASFEPVNPSQESGVK